MGGISCLAPGSSCLACSVSKQSSSDLGDGWLWCCGADGGTGKARRSGSLTGAQQLPSESLLCSAVPCCPCQWPLTSPAGSCTPAPTLLSVFGQAKVCKTEAQLLCHVLNLGLSPLLLLLFPTAGAPSRWAVVLNRGEHHHSNKTPKQPQELSPLQDTFPPTANTGHQSPSSEPGFAFLT